LTAGPQPPELCRGPGDEGLPPLLLRRVPAAGVGARLILARLARASSAKPDPSCCCCWRCQDAGLRGLLALLLLAAPPSMPQLLNPLGLMLLLGLPRGCQEVGAPEPDPAPCSFIPASCSAATLVAAAAAARSALEGRLLSRAARRVLQYDSKVGSCRNACSSGRGGSCGDSAAAGDEEAAAWNLGSGRHWPRPSGSSLLLLPAEDGACWGSGLGVPVPSCFLMDALKRARGVSCRLSNPKLDRPRAERGEAHALLLERGDDRGRSLNRGEQRLADSCRPDRSLLMVERRDCSLSCSPAGTAAGISGSSAGRISLGMEGPAASSSSVSDMLPTRATTGHATQDAWARKKPTTGL
jgi:hypothetical protein